MDTTTVITGGDAGGGNVKGGELSNLVELSTPYYLPSTYEEKEDVRGKMSPIRSRFSPDLLAKISKA